MGVHISEFQTWLNQELSSNTPMFPNFYTDYLEFSEEWGQTVFPHRTLPLTGGTKVRSNSETESLASGATGVSEESVNDNLTTAYTFLTEKLGYPAGNVIMIVYSIGLVVPAHKR